MVPSEQVIRNGAPVDGILEVSVFFGGFPHKLIIPKRNGPLFLPGSLGKWTKASLFAMVTKGGGVHFCPSI